MKASDVRRYAESKGWTFARRGSRSSHLIYEHCDYKYILSIPEHGSRNIAPGTLNKIIKQIEGRWKPK
jgi:predicted RNA binding protein YcfA (HicA-like mRNA interferase family)